MKNKWLVIMMSAVLAVSGPCVSAAGAELGSVDLSDGSELYDGGSEVITPQEEFVPQGEAVLQEEPALKESLSSGDSLDVWTGEAEAGSIGVAEEGVACFTGAYASKELFQKWQSWEELTDAEWESMEWCSSSTPMTFSEFMKQIPGKNTGFCFVATIGGTEKGFLDISVPEGMKVGMDGLNTPVDVIVPGGDLILETNVLSPGSIQIMEGKGEVTFRDGKVEGVITGNGPMDKIVFGGQLGHRYPVSGIRGVEQIKFENDRTELLITEGPVEIYDVINNVENSFDPNDKDIRLSMEMFDDKRIPVFHRALDLGTTQEYDDFGNMVWRPATFDVSFVNSSSDDYYVDVGVGAPIVRFAVQDDAMILNNVNRIKYKTGNEYFVDMDGKIYPHYEYGFQVKQYLTTSGMSAQQAFEADGIEGYMSDNMESLGKSASFENAVRRLRGATAMGGSGYAALDIPPYYYFQEVLKVPEGMKGLKCYPYIDMYEGMEENCSPYIPEVQMPAGTKLSLMDYVSSSGGAMKASGGGELEFIRGRVRQKVTAEGTVRVLDTTFQSLKCHTLISEYPWSTMAVERGLNFQKAQLNSTEIYALPGAVLDMGEIDNRVCDSPRGLDVYLGEDAIEVASVNFNGNMYSGAGITISRCDTERAKAERASFAQNCFSVDYCFDRGSMGEEDNFSSYLKEYSDKPECIAAIREEVLKNTDMENIFFLFGGKGAEAVELKPRYLVADQFDPADSGIEGDHYKTAYYDGNTGAMVKSEKYIRVPNSKSVGIVQTDKGKFLMADGKIVNDYHGLWYFDTDQKWYFLAYGQVQDTYTGVTMYDNEFFYIQDGVLDKNATGIVWYDGSAFLFAEGHLLNSYSGLWQDIINPEDWYFLANGQVQTQHSGVAMYDNAFFVVDCGMLDRSYNGIIEYDGAKFKVVNGQLIIK